MLRIRNKKHCQKQLRIPVKKHCQNQCCVSETRSIVRTGVSELEPTGAEVFCRSRSQNIYSAPVLCNRLRLKHPRAWKYKYYFCGIKCHKFSTNSAPTNLFAGTDQKWLGSSTLVRTIAADPKQDALSELGTNTVLRIRFHFIRSKSVFLIKKIRSQNKKHWLASAVDPFHFIRFRIRFLPQNRSYIRCL